MRTQPSWDPAAYSRFGEQRSRPFADLVAQVRSDDPELVVDLGCGNGPATLTLGELWPNARIVGVDDAESMLEAARTFDTQNRVEWVQADLKDWDPASLGQAPDVIITNSTLQWVPGHLNLLPTWMDALSPGGWLALQVPNNFDAPSHALMREIAATHARANELLAALDLPAVGEPKTYLTFLSRLGAAVDAWETVYSHVLDPEGASQDPVLDWVSATGLRPVLDLLPEGEERDAFVKPYAAALREAYPRSEMGVLFAFRRVFAVARKNDVTTQAPAEAAPPEAGE